MSGGHVHDQGHGRTGSISAGGAVRRRRLVVLGITTTVLVAR